MGLCMVAMAVSTLFVGNRTPSIISALFLFVYNFFLSLGFLGATFLYPAEVAPSRLRIVVQSISTANQWLWYSALPFPSLSYLHWVAWLIALF